MMKLRTIIVAMVVLLATACGTSKYGIKSTAPDEFKGLSPSVPMKASSIIPFTTTS